MRQSIVFLATAVLPPGGPGPPGRRAIGPPATLARPDGGVEEVPAVPDGDLPAGEDGSVKLKLDLHDIYNRGTDIDRALQGIIDEAVAKRAPLVEIIPGKGSGQLKKHVLRFLERKDIKSLYHRVEKDSDNFGRVFVHFRWK
jgi:hypothetical protein